MKITNILEKLPNYAKDINLNYSSLISNHSIMTENQFYGSLMVAAITSRNLELNTAIKEFVTDKISEETMHEVNTAATLMAMNNIYYRFTHLVENPEYSKMPAGLRMNAMREINNKVDFELFSLVASSITGCGLCVSSHEKTLVAHGLSKEVIQMSIKIASVIHAIAIASEIS